MKPTEEQIEELVDIAYWMIIQNCKKDTKGNYFSGFVGVNAQAMRLLCKLGLMEMVDDAFHRNVTVRIKS
jgi:hypothetical protein